MPEFAEFERFSLKRHPELDERCVQEQVTKKPSILGLGNVEVIARERIQPDAGRLDLLLEDEDDTRYEVEIQLGDLDASHIIRTIEYWDLERKLRPDYNHVAVIVAENITSRFFNVISLFHRCIPLIAIQLNAFRLDEKIGLMFTTVLDLTYGLNVEDEEIQKPVDRSSWESRASRETMQMVDKLLEIARQFDRTKTLNLKYNKEYIGLTKQGRQGGLQNYLSFKPQKSAIWFRIYLKRADELDRRMEEVGLYYKPSVRNCYLIRLQPADLEKNEELLAQLICEATEIANRQE